MSARLFLIATGLHLREPPKPELWKLPSNSKEQGRGKATLTDFYRDQTIAPRTEPNCRKNLHFLVTADTPAPQINL
jgi:hypothetical protein